MPTTDQKKKCLGCEYNSLITKPIVPLFGRTIPGLPPIKNGAIHAIDCYLSDFYNNFPMLKP